MSPKASKQYDLTRTTLISFEINKECNLKHIHPQCPINRRRYKNSGRTLDADTILSCIDQAKQLGFGGYVTFHNYNEPLLSKDMMLEVIDRSPDTRFLLWTNGLLLEQPAESNVFLKKFHLVYISCYDPENLQFFKEVQAYHGRAQIEMIQLDDRLDAYTRDHENIIGCKRPLFDIPIDYHGNLQLCCFDWDNQYEIGNIFDMPLKEIVLSVRYQKLLEGAERRRLDLNSCPPICKKCSHPWVTYAKYYDINLYSNYGKEPEEAVP